MGTFIAILIAFTVGAIAGNRYAREDRARLQHELDIEKGFNSNDDFMARVAEAGANMPAKETTGISLSPAQEREAEDEISAFIETGKGAPEPKATKIAVSDGSRKQTVKIAKAKTHLIQIGDTWAGIARKLGARQRDLIQFGNNPTYGKTIHRSAKGAITQGIRHAGISDDSARILATFIEDTGPETWISKRLLRSKLRWSDQRIEKALDHLKTNNKIKTLDAKPNRGAKYQVESK